MALINCPECGKEISDKSEMCPNCGCPKSEYTDLKQDSNAENNDMAKELPQEEQPEMEPCYGCGIMIPTNIAVCPFCNYNYGKCREWGQLTQPKTQQAEESRSNFDDVFSSGKASTALNVGAIKRTRALISKNENVVYSSVANVCVNPVFGRMSGSFSLNGKENGVFTITNKRILFVSSTFGLGIQKEIAIKDITSVDTQNSFISCPVRINGITEMFVVDCNRYEQTQILNAISSVR